MLHRRRAGNYYECRQSLHVARAADDFSRMKKLGSTLIALICLALATTLAAFAEDAASPIGTWVTQKGGAHIQIKDCGGKLCGTIVWLKNPLDKNGKDSVDSKNPDPSLQTRKLM